MPSYTPPRSGENAVLILSSSEKTRDSLPLFLGAGWVVHHAELEQEAVELLDRYEIAVIIADGNWREILDVATQRACPPSVIVTAPFADETLWAEVLNRGGYDVLAQPFEANEVTRISQAALRRSKMARPHVAGPTFTIGLT